MKIACFLMDKNQELMLKSLFENIRIFSGPLNERNIRNVLNANILVSRPRGMKLKFDKVTLSKFKNLKLICSMSTGVDHIDLEYCRAKDIQVFSVPSYSETSVAEQTFALILSISRKIPQALGPRNDIENLTGFELKGKALGVIGSGKIGLEVIKIAKAFGMNIFVYDIFENKEAAKEIGFEYINLDDLLRLSDIITVHVPYTKKTFHLLNKDNMSIIKKGSVLINTSRGELIDSDTLYHCLSSGRISFAGLDVLERGSRWNRIFLKMKNVLVTPHNGANTREAKDRVLRETINKLSNFVLSRGKNNESGNQWE